MRLYLFVIIAFTGLYFWRKYSRKFMDFQSGPEAGNEYLEPQNSCCRHYQRVYFKDSSDYEGWVLKIAEEALLELRKAGKDSGQGTHYCQECKQLWELVKPQEGDSGSMLALQACLKKEKEVS